MLGYCLRIFDPKEITEWIEDTSRTAVCPYLSIDSSIINRYTVDIHDVLEKMYQHLMPPGAQ